MNNLHFNRWSNQLRNSDHEIYWFDIKDQRYSPQLSWMSQVVEWKKRFLKKRGRSFLKSRFPSLFEYLSLKLDQPVEKVFEKALIEIAPHVVHSFALYISCTPIFEVMIKYKDVKWLYSSWGSDLYYYQNIPEYLKDIKAVLPRMNYLMPDYNRDHHIAETQCLKGCFLGAVPGGGGFELDQFQKNMLPVSERNVILIKGNQNRFGRAILVLKALVSLKSILKDYKIIVFGAQNEEVIQFEKEQGISIKVHQLLSHVEVLKLMSSALIYIGNSNSDGMPNTMLEAICCGAFPIQSNPDNATAEVIDNKQNELPIEECESMEEITSVISIALLQPEMIKHSFEDNQKYAKIHLVREVVTKHTLAIYQQIKPTSCNSII